MAYKVFKDYSDFDSIFLTDSNKLTYEEIKIRVSRLMANPDFQDIVLDLFIKDTILKESSKINSIDKDTEKFATNKLVSANVLKNFLSDCLFTITEEDKGEY